MPIWLQITLPRRIKLMSYAIEAPSDQIDYIYNSLSYTPSDWYILGCDDSSFSNATIVDAQSNIKNWVGSEKRVFSFESSSYAFSNYRMLINSNQTANNSTTGARVGEWRLFGVDEDPTIYDLYEYPPLRMTTSSLKVAGATYGNGEYNATASSTTSNADAYFAFSKGIVKTGSTSNGWGASELAPQWLQLDMSASVGLAKYTIASGDLGIARAADKAPSAWRVQGYNSGAASWCNVDVRSNVAWSFAQEKKTFDIARTELTAYNMFRLQIDATQGSTELPHVDEWTLFAYNFPETRFPPIAYSPNVSSDPTSTTINETLIVNEVGGGLYQTASTSTYASGGIFYNATFAFDGNSQAVWRGNTVTLPQYLSIHMPSRVVLKRFELQASTLYAYDRAPSAFDVEASNDGITWVVLASYTGQLFTFGSEIKYYRLSVPSKPYYWFRLKINGLVRGTNADPELASWNLYGDEEGIREYPPAALTGLTTTLTGNSYGNGTYVVSEYPITTSSGPSRFFSKQIKGGNNYYSGSSPSFPNSFPYYVTLQMPVAIQLYSYKLHAQDHSIETMPGAWQILASDDSAFTNPVVLDSKTNVSWTVYQLLNFPLATPSQAYRFYRLLITAMAGRAKVEREYPPVALSGDVTIVTNQAYGNGQYKVSYSVGTGNYAGWRMFDKSTDYGWVPTISSLTNPLATVTIQLAEPIQLTRYTLQNLSNYNRSPGAWTLQGSVDGITWTVLSTQTGVTWTATNQVQSWTPSAGTDTYYSFFKLVITECQGVGEYNLQVQELRLYTLTADHEFPSQLLWYANNTYTASSYVTYDPGQYIVTTNMSAGPEGGWAWATINVFKKSTENSCWGNNTTLPTPMWVQVQCPKYFVLTRYVIKNHNGANATAAASLNNSPKSWVVWGSTDGGNFQSIDTRSGIVWTYAGQHQTFITDSSTLYNYFRLTVSDVQGSTNDLHMMEWRLYSGTEDGESNMRCGEWSLHGVECDTSTAVEYPPQALVHNNTEVTDVAYGNGLYEIKASSMQDATLNAWCAFGKSSGWLNRAWRSATADANRLYLQMTVPNAIKVLYYSVQLGDYDPNVLATAPRGWVVLGTNDGSTWKPVHATSSVSWSSPGEVQWFRVLSTNQTTAYTTFRLSIFDTVSATNTVHIGEWRLFAKPPTDGWCAFNGDANFNWVSYETNAGQLQLELPTPIVVSSYELEKVATFAGSTATPPTDWSFQASQDATNWTTLASQTGQTLAPTFKQTLR